MFNKYKLYKSDVFTVKILPCSFINSQHFSFSYIKKTFFYEKRTCFFILNNIHSNQNLQRISNHCYHSVFDNQYQ